MALSNRLRVALAGLLSATGAFLFGLDIGYIAPILEDPDFKRTVAHLSDWEQPGSEVPSVHVGFIVGIFSVGCICTALPCVSGFFLDVIGRRNSIAVGTAAFLVGASMQAVAVSIWTMCVGRFVAGCSIGLLSTVVSLYQSEIAPKSMRGALTSVYQLMITFGILAAVTLNAMLVRGESTSGNWRFTIWLQCVPAVLLLLVLPLLPRSPRWLVQRGEEEAALQVLLVIRSSEEEAASELAEIVADYKESMRQQALPGASDFLRGRVGQLLTIGITLQLLQQLVGMNAFMYFGPRVFVQLGFDGTTFQWISCLVNFLATFPAIVLADSFGRRQLLVWSAAGMTLACSVMGLCGQMLISPEMLGTGAVEHGFLKYAVFTSILFFIVNFAYGWGPIVWVYCAEMFPLAHRARCVSFTTTACWIGNFVIAQFTPILLKWLGFSTFFLFGFFCLCGLALALWLPETKGVLLENIDKLFDEKLGVDHNERFVESGTSAVYGSVEKTT